MAELFDLFFFYCRGRCSYVVLSKAVRRQSRVCMRDSDGGGGNDDDEAIAIVSAAGDLPLIHIPERTRQAEITHAVLCLNKKKK